MSRYVDTYAEVKTHGTSSLRERARGLALDVLAKVGSDKQMSRPRVQFLYIHHTFKDELPSLVRLVDHLKRHFEIISHSEAVRRIWEDDIDKPYLSISSDDGFKNNVLAAKVLSERDISACFFINPGLVGEGDFNRVKTHCADKLHFPPVEFLDWSDVESLLSMGHEIGSHTMEHMRISSKSTDEVRKDIVESHQVLTERCGKVDHFAWPYGLFSDCNAEAVKAVFEAGYTSCSSAERGAHFGGEKLAIEQLCIRRDHVILDWPLAHIHYFLRKAAAAPGKDGFEWA